MPAPLLFGSGCCFAGAFAGVGLGRFSKTRGDRGGFKFPCAKDLVKSETVKAGKEISGKALISPSKADLSKFEDVAFDDAGFVTLLGELISQSKWLQNNPRLSITPEEERAAEIVLRSLKPCTKEMGGRLLIEKFVFAPKRPNLKIVLPSASYPKGPTISFVGSHMDVVPANPEEWDTDPFSMTVDGDKLIGRGTTDCLGHVALLTGLLKKLATSKAQLNRSIVVVFIAAEEGGETGIGVDKLVEVGALDVCKQGPVYWIDSADSQPCCGTAGMFQWTLKATGRPFHSGLPHRGINPIELLSEALSALQQQFYRDFPQLEADKRWGFVVSTTMKATQIECSKGSLNQIPAWCTAHGDVRLSPFFDIAVCRQRLEQYVKELNDQIDSLPTRGPWSKYTLPDDVGAEVTRGLLELSFAADVSTARMYEGYAADIDGVAHKTLVQSTREVVGSENVKPYSINGTLPLVRQMKNAGFDLQCDGFGLMNSYHAVNEFCKLSHMRRAHEVLLRVIAHLDVI